MVRSTRSNFCHSLPTQTSQGIWLEVGHGEWDQSAAPTGYSRHATRSETSHRRYKPPSCSSHHHPTEWKSSSVTPTSPFASSTGEQRTRMGSHPKKSSLRWL